MKTPPMRILLIGGTLNDRPPVLAALADHVQSGAWVVECAARLVDGLDRLRENGVAAVLLDLCLPDGEGIGAFGQIRRAAPHVPILVIGSAEQEGVLTQAFDSGTQDYLPRDRVDPSRLRRALARVVERQAAEEALFFARQRADVTLRSIGDGVLCTDAKGIVTYLNPAAERMTGWTGQEAVGRPLADVFWIVDATTRAPARDPVERAMQLDRIVGLTPNCLLLRRDGVETAIDDSASPIHDRAGRVIGGVIVFHDVSAARALSLQAVHLSQHDFLTDLPNRMLLHDRLTQAIARAKRSRRHLAVLFLDLDRFKHVNDSLGHAIGDLLLQSVARRLLTCVRGSDTVSRQGGDEFVVLLSEIEQAGDTVATATKIMAALMAPHDIAEHRLHITVTIGISVYPDDGADASTLINRADTAMYHARERSRNTYQFFEAERTGAAAS